MREYFKEKFWNLFRVSYIVHLNSTEFYASNKEQIIDLMGKNDYHFIIEYTYRTN